MWGFPALRVFLDLCVNSRVLHIQPYTCEGVCVSVHVLGAWQFTISVSPDWASLRRTPSLYFSRNDAAYLAPVSGLTAADWTRGSVENRSGWDTVCSLKCLEGALQGHLRGLWPLRVMFSSRSPSLTPINGGVHAGDSRADDLGWNLGIDRSYPEGTVTSASHRLRSPSGSHSPCHPSWHLLTLGLDLQSSADHTLNCVNACVKNR